jgi:hypothetical protein
VFAPFYCLTVSYLQEIKEKEGKKGEKCSEGKNE